MFSFCNTLITSFVAPGDYLALNARLVFTVGQSVGSIVCTRLNITDDRVVENNEENLSLFLSADEPSVTIVTAMSSTVVITQNDNDGNVILVVNKFATIICLM